MARTKKYLTEEALLVAYKIREARAAKFETIDAAATPLGLDASLWGRWEKALVTPQKATLKKVAKHLGVSVPFFYQKPDEWDASKEEFLLGLIRRSRTKKGYFQPLLQSFKNTHGSENGEQEAADAKHGRAKVAQDHRGDRRDGNDALGVFLQITKLITDAQAKVRDGLIDRETYDLHMRTIADMARLSLLTEK